MIPRPKLLISDPLIRDWYPVSRNNRAKKTRVKAILTDDIAIPRWLTLILIGVVITGIGWFANWYLTSYVPALITKEVSSQLAPFSDRLLRLETGSLLENLRKLTAPNEDLLKTLPKVRGLLRSAKDRGTITSPQAISEIATDLLNRTSGDPNLQPVAWDTMMQFIEYRSFLNAVLYPSAHSKYPGQSADVFIPENAGPIEFQRAHFQNATVRLDRGIFKDCLFENVTVIYKGGSVELKNVQFENCRFEIDLSPKAKTLTQELVASTTPSITISS